ncbi:hypothetical protein HID58_092448, partial [Brassica napus]
AGQTIHACLASNHARATAICQQSEPVVVQIDKLDLVLEENPDADVTKGPSSAQSPTASGKSNGYGFADKIADGMTLQVKVANLLLETGGGAHREGGAAWPAAPLASITIRNLVLYTTNESWKVVNLKEARDFSTNTGFIYLFKKLEWAALSIDLLPHPDMFTDANLARSEEENLRDDDGASKTSFLWRRTLFRWNFWPSTCKTFVSDCLLVITVQRTALNSPLGLEIQLHIPETVCPALSEPGLRALLRFLTGMYLCLNRGDVDPKSQQQDGLLSLVSVLVDHVFLCIKDAEFQLDLLMQSLLFSRACISDGESANYFTKILIGCTLDLPTLSSGQAIPKTTTFVLNDSYPVPTTHGSSPGRSLFKDFFVLPGKDVSLEVAMVSADGKPLITISPLGGIVRIGVACEQYISNASVEQLFFVLDLYSYFGKHTAVKLALKDLQLKFLESSFTSSQDTPLVQFFGKDLVLKLVSCNGSTTPLRRVFWVVNGRHDGHSGSVVVTPFLDISITHVIPVSEKDMECHRLTLSSGPLSILFQASMVDDRTQDGTLGKGMEMVLHIWEGQMTLMSPLNKRLGREGHYLPGGVNIEANIVASEDKSGHDDTLNWVAESLKFSVNNLTCVENLIVSKPYLLDPSLYLKALKLCSYQTLEKQFVLIHGNSVTNGFISNLHLNNSLVNLYARHGDMKHARKLFDRMPERDVVSWTAMISGYSGCGYHRSAFLLFKQMRREPVRANDFTYGSVLKSCKVWDVHGCVEKGRFVENLVVRSALLCLYAKCGKMEDARLLFESMKERDLVSWNIIIHGYTASAADTSFGLFQLMLAEGKKPDCYTFGSLLRASIQVNCLEMVSELHGFAIKLGFKRSDVALVRSLIVAYAKCGSLGNALKLYDRTMKGDLISCTAIITGLAQQNNFTSDAFDIFKEMILMKTQMDEVVVSSMLKICTTIASISIGRQIHCFALKSSQIRFDVALRNSLIDMYAKSGEIEDAVLAFEEMEEKDVRSWTSLISGYGRHGDIEKAISLYNRMEQEGIKPNDVTFLALLSACSHTGETEIGWKILNTMINKYGIKVREEHLSCMVDMLARGGNLEDAYELIRSENSITSLSSSTCGAFLMRAGDMGMCNSAK